MGINRLLPAAALAGLLLPVIAGADDLNSGDTAWMLTATALVLFMTLPGLALFYAGLVRAKNVLSVLMQCFSIAAAGSLLWVIVGYSLALTPGATGWFGGFDQVMLKSLTIDSVSGTMPETVFVMFQMTFAIITPALIIGGFAERMRFSAMMIFSMAWLLLVYAPVCYWVWGGGWLAEMGFRDFAGGAVVHINAGVAAIVAAMVLGNRRGFPTTPMPPHNLPMTVTGAGMLWVGWFGFNAGSALAADGAAGMAMLVTHLGAAGGCLAWMAMEWIRHGKPSVLGIVTGMVAGLGTITPQRPELQNVEGYGVWKDGEWTVVFIRPMQSDSKWDVDFNRKDPILVALAVWDGVKEDRNGRKVVSVWQRLNIEMEPKKGQGG